MAVVVVVPEQPMAAAVAAAGATVRIMPTDRKDLPIAVVVAEVAQERLLTIVPVVPAVLELLF